MTRRRFHLVRERLKGTSSAFARKRRLSQTADWPVVLEAVSFFWQGALGGYGTGWSALTVAWAAGIAALSFTSGARATTSQVSQPGGNTQRLKTSTAVDHYRDCSCWLVDRIRGPLKRNKLNRISASSLDQTEARQQQFRMSYVRSSAKTSSAT